MSWDHLNCSDCFSDSKLSDIEESNKSQLHNRYSTSSDVEMSLIVSKPIQFTTSSPFSTYHHPSTSYPGFQHQIELLKSFTPREAPITKNRGIRRSSVPIVRWVHSLSDWHLGGILRCNEEIGNFFQREVAIQTHQIESRCSSIESMAE